MRATVGSARDVTFLGAVIVAVTLLIDQWSKAFARGHLPLCELNCGSVSPGLIGLARVENAGSVGGWAPGIELWTFIAALAVVGLFCYGRLRTSPELALAWGLALGGAAGNLVDRLLMGAVTDFIRLAPVGSVVIVFNVADVALALGAIGLSFIFHGAYGHPSARKQSVLVP